MRTKIYSNLFRLFISSMKLSSIFFVNSFISIKNVMSKMNKKLKVLDFML